jgi:hypothetical protein
MGWLAPRPGRFTPGKETRYPLYRRLGGPQVRSGRLRKISPPPGFDPRTVQPVASHYTDCAIPARSRQYVLAARNRASVFRRIILTLSFVTLYSFVLCDVCYASGSCYNRKITRFTWWYLKTGTLFRSLHYRCVFSVESVVDCWVGLSQQFGIAGTALPFFGHFYGMFFFRSTFNSVIRFAQKRG